MATARVNVPGYFWEYFKRTGIINGRDTSQEAALLRTAFADTTPRKNGASYLLPVEVTPETAVLLSKHVDAVMDGFKDVVGRNDNQLFRSARLLRDRMNAAMEGLAHKRAMEGYQEPAEGTWDQWTLKGPHARRGAAVAVSKAITATTGLRPQPAESRGKGINDLRVSGSSVGVHVFMGTDDPRHWDTEATFGKIWAGLESRGYVLQSSGVRVDAERGSESASIWVKGKLK